MDYNTNKVIEYYNLQKNKLEVRALDNLKNIKELLENKVITEEEYNLLASRLQPAKTINDYTWNDIIENYTKWCSGKYTKTTLNGYRICIAKFAAYLNDMESTKKVLNVKFKPYTFQTVNKYIDWLQKDNLSSQAISKAKYSLLSLNNFLGTLGIKTADIEAIKTPIKAYKEENLTALREEEIIDIANLSDTRTKVLILLCYEGGMKRHELAKIRVQDFDFKKKQLFVYRDNGDINRVCILSGKTIRIVKNYIDDLYEDVNRWNKSRELKGKELREDYGYIFQSVKTPTPSYPLLQSLLKQTARNYYGNKCKGDELKRKVNNFTFEYIRNSRRIYLMAHGKTVPETMNLVGDRNYMSTYKLQKLVPVLYPELCNTNN